MRSRMPIEHLGIVGEGIDADSLAELHTQDEIIDCVTEAAEATLAERQTRYGEQTWAMVERLVLLRSIDQLWVDHLTELDDFRRGVGLRGYGGTDPLVEFKREAFKLYDELRDVHPPPGRHDHLPGQRPGAAARCGAAAAPEPAHAHAPADGHASGRGSGTCVSGPARLRRGEPDGGRPGRVDGLRQRRRAARRAVRRHALGHGHRGRRHRRDGGHIQASGDDLDLDAEDLAPYDEIEGDEAAPGFVDARPAAVAVPVAAAEAIVPGLAPKPVRQMTLQHGDEADREPSPLPPRPVARVRASAATTLATAAPASSTRSATASSPRAST